MMANPDGIVLYGIGSRYVHEVYETALRAQVEVLVFVDNLAPMGDYPGLAPVASPADCTEQHKGVGAFIPLVTPGHRKRVLAELVARGFTVGNALIDPTAVLASTTVYGSGFLVNAAVVIGANCEFGEQVLINRSVSIGHDARVEDFASFGPGCVLCGDCRIGAGAFIGGGATLAPGVQVGRNAIVGAGSVVVKNVPDNTIVAGNPAQIKRTDIAGYNNCGV
jgi:sugar O-acyltransferase (sialic acid O-acetyltransferase NeuD family)